MKLFGVDKIIMDSYLHGETILYSIEEDMKYKVELKELKAKISICNIMVIIIGVSSFIIANYLVI